MDNGQDDTVGWLFPLAATLSTGVVIGSQVFADWPNTDRLALIGVLAAILGLGATAASTYSTSRTTKEILAQELRATLDMSQGYQRVNDPDQGFAFDSIADYADGGPKAHFVGYVRNIGRYPARDVALSAFHGQTKATLQNPPAPIIFPNELPDFFDILMPTTPPDPKDIKSAIKPLLTSADPIRLVFDFNDGNEHTPPYEVCFRFHFDPKARVTGGDPGRWVSTKVACPRSRGVLVLR